MKKMMFLFLIINALVGCVPPKMITYHPNDFINPNRVVVKEKALPKPSPVVHATYGFGDDPRILKAYQLYTKKGVAKNIQSNGLKTIAYDPYAHPVIACAPLRLCVFQFEQGEEINDIALGDAKDWYWSQAWVGSDNDGSYQLIIRPKKTDIATDLLVTTTKRTYQLGLVSQAGAMTHMINFYYPRETLSIAQHEMHHRVSSPFQKEIVTQTTQANLNNLHFNYTLSGASPLWRPVRVFDDGHKTMIQMPAVSSEVDLPVLYILRDRTMQLVNYRYQSPYYIVDGLFKTAYLVSGKGFHQVKVIIHNQSLT